MSQPAAKTQALIDALNEFAMSGAQPPEFQGAQLRRDIEAIKKQHAADGLMLEGIYAFLQHDKTESLSKFRGARALSQDLYIQENCAVTLKRLGETEQAVQMLANLAHMNPSGRMRYSLSLLTAGAYRMAVEMYRGIPNRAPSRMDNLLPVLWAFDTRDEDTIARIQCAIQWVWDQNSYALAAQVAAWDNEGILHELILPGNIEDRRLDAVEWGVERAVKTRLSIPEMGSLSISCRRYTTTLQQVA
ncbi:hypothetical protein [Acidithiobacillus sp.]|jgi:hypothetical protein|uniref:hypothetical protein n=1 Tax=Acidithiobacillus sp. TaxID=1872118 RepID=UPI003567A5C9